MGSVKLCSFDKCERLHVAKGWCAAHYRQYGKGGPMLPLQNYPRQIVCVFEGCDHLVATSRYCRGHQSQKKRGQELTHLKPRRPNGSGSINRDGYHQVGIDGKPAQFVHRLVMEETLGRPLLDTETVHHLNGNKLDNSPTNLQLWATSQPAGQRVEDLLAWAHEIIDRYEPKTF